MPDRKTTQFNGMSAFVLFFSLPRSRRCKNFWPLSENRPMGKVKSLPSRIS